MAFICGYDSYPIQRASSNNFPSTRFWQRNLFHSSAMGSQIEKPKVPKRSKEPSVAQVLIGVSPFCAEGFDVKRLSTGSLSPIEREVIAEIRALRASSVSVLASTLLMSPARSVHHFIQASHGNVQLRMVTIARELGVEMRTLERTFSASTKKQWCSARLRFV